MYKLAFTYAKRYTKRAFDQDDATQEGVLKGWATFNDKRIPKEKRWQYAKFQVYFGVIEYVRTKLCLVRIRGGKEQRNYQVMETNVSPDVPDEQWRRDLKSIEAKLDFEALVAKLERRAGRLGLAGDRQKPPELRLVAACGSINETCRQLNINRQTFLLRLSKLRA